MSQYERRFSEDFVTISYRQEKFRGKYMAFAAYVHTKPKSLLGLSFMIDN